MISDLEWDEWMEALRLLAFQATYTNSVLRTEGYMELLYYPNKILEQKCEPVLDFDSNLGSIIDEMKAVMEKHKGIGLSANQVGILKKIMLIKNTKGEVYELINPLVLEVDGESTMLEGCLSFPTVYLKISRPAQVMFQYQDRAGEVKKAMAEGIEARIFLHEMEHLEGKVYLSKVNREQRQLAKKQLRKARGR